jgi:hypothetical protein
MRLKDYYDKKSNFEMSAKSGLSAMKLDIAIMILKSL